MQELSDIFEIFRGPTGLASEIGEKADTVLRWKLRNRIPDHAWNSVITAAKRRGRTLTVAKLLELNTPKRSPWESRNRRATK